MKKVSNSFHSSRGQHSISNASKLAKVQAHNERGYFNREYDHKNIHPIFGEIENLASDVKNYINETFNPEIEKANEKQKQACRRITTDAYTHFSENKNLDIANEIIFQVADREYWGRFREEKLIKKGTRTYVKKIFPEEVKNVMDDIFRRQGEAYEQIYQTHKDVILEKIRGAYDAAVKLMEDIEPEKRSVFLQIAQAKQDKRRTMLEKLSDDELDEFDSFFEAHETYEFIKSKRLIERTEGDEMTIKLVNMMAHYDEWSPHAHGVSVCSTSGYVRGLGKRVAKSVVLNKYVLEVLQDRMREIAKEEMDKHPEIFYETELAGKKKGRNIDYETEEWMRMKLQELQEDVVQINQEKETAAQEKENIEKEITVQREILKSTQEEVAEWDKILEEVGDEKAYVAEAEKAYGIIDFLKDLVDRLVNRIGFARDKELEKNIRETFSKFYEALTQSIKKMRMYEVRERVPLGQRKSEPIVEAKESLEKQIQEAGNSTGASAPGHPAKERDGIPERH